ncbi:hypothetical protein [Pseudoalteromonas sp. NJ631]|uniref:hypothetical protein n=1 Tax=Pseudoalteromonas sp. NJ631 TaxID=493915 RepID=UPI00030190AD|nr:hypothetical protein [Pseudoalteromonas sp. NJ631]
MSYRRKKELLHYLLEEDAIVLLDLEEVFRIRRELEEIRSQLNSVSRNQGCRYSNENNNDLNLIITKENKDTGIKKIKNWLKNKPKTLRIIDPFIFTFDEKRKPDHIANLEAYVRYVCDFVPKVLNEVHIYSNESPSEQVVALFEQVLAENNITMIRYESSEIHDRFFIRNDTAAKVMGTSFTGLGAKLSMFASLESEDLDDLLEYVRDIPQA